VLVTAVLLGHFEPNSEEWHAARRKGIGASEIAAVVGLSPFESAFSLWHRKKGNLPGPDPANPLFYWGHALEPLVAARYASDHPEFAVHKVGTYVHSERAWQLANLDRALSTGDRVGEWGQPGALPTAVLEIKTTRYGDNWGPHRSAQVPLHVRCQVMQQMDVMGVEFADVAVLIGGNDYREYRIDYDETDALALREAGAAFWASIETDDEPPVDASWATYEAVRDLHPNINGEDVEVNAALYARYAATKADADSSADAHRQAKSELLAAMGEARRALVDDVPVLRRQPGRNGSVSLYPIAQKEAS
jgi:putative phage-type endonuclease